MLKDFWAVLPGLQRVKLGCFELKGFYSHLKENVCSLGVPGTAREQSDMLTHSGYSIFFVTLNLLCVPSPCKFELNP